MKKLKIYLSPTDFINSHMIEGHEKEWINNILTQGEDKLLLSIVESKIIHKRITNIYSEMYYVSADCESYKELELLIKNFEKVIKKPMTELSRMDLLKLSSED